MNNAYIQHQTSRITSVHDGVRVPAWCSTSSSSHFSNVRTVRPKQYQRLRKLHCSATALTEAPSRSEVHSPVQRMGLAATYDCNPAYYNQWYTVVVFIHCDILACHSVLYSALQFTVE
jgi:hypothetical protein